MIFFFFVKETSIIHFDKGKLPVFFPYIIFFLLKACSWILIYIYLCIGILLSLHILKRWSSGHTPLGVSALLLICMANLLVLFSSLYVHIKLWLLRKEYSAERFDGAICILFKWFSSILSEKKNFAQYLSFRCFCGYFLTLDGYMYCQVASR